MRGTLRCIPRSRQPLALLSYWSAPSHHLVLLTYWFGLRGGRTILALVRSSLVLDEDFNQPGKLFHNSFPDLTTDPSRCANTRFFVSPGYLHLEPVTNCLRAINDRLEQNHPSIPDYALNLEVKGLETRINHLSVTLWYACQSTQPPHQDQGRRRRYCLQHTCFLEEKFLA